ncbi:hypothetical protein MMC18_008708 [Xylographa bjoerkii]|nr:hypothetical protein [Xylographa bjoerkii]
MIAAQGFHITATNEELVALCRSQDCKIIAGGKDYSEKVIQISDCAVIKVGIGVKKEEAQNQEKAYNLIDPRIVRIPRVYRFFTYKSSGYIVMEYIEGRTITPSDYHTVIPRVAAILSQFATIRGESPGPLCGGVSCGLLWPEDEDLLFDTTQAMEDFFASRLSNSEVTLAIRDFDLSLCHLDIAPRNIIISHDNSLYILDWASAGYYPRFFEIIEQRIVSGDDFHKRLLEEMQSLTIQEEQQGQLIHQAWFRTQKFHL